MQNRAMIAGEALQEEILAMFRVCFEGESKIEDGVIQLKLPNGQRFQISLQEVKEGALC